MHEHQPPSYNNKGQMEDNMNTNVAKKHLYNGLSNQVKLPPTWCKEKAVRTQSALKEWRRKEARAHLSYDLDGDGIVSGRDLVLAQHFDKNSKGRLDSRER